VVRTDAAGNNVVAVVNDAVDDFNSMGKLIALLRTAIERNEPLRISA
jgi:hypothetical protein